MLGSEWISCRRMPLTRHDLPGLVFGLLLYLLAIVVLPPVATRAQAGGDIPGTSGELVICLPGAVETLDPTDHRSRMTQRVVKNIFDSLTTRDDTNTALPQLAASWELVDDTSWRFRLRRGVRFHNGDPFTAADVQYTLDRVVDEDGLDGRPSPRKSLLGPISTVLVEDSYTVRITTRHPWANLPLLLSLQEIVPAAHLKAVGSRQFAAHPVGTGPFKFVQGESGEDIVLERFQDYYGGSPRRPPVQTAPLQQVRFKTVPSRLDQVAMLKSGQCDIIGDLPPESIGILAMSPGIRVVTTQATRSYFAEMNCTRWPLNDIRVRQAFNYGVDIGAMVRHTMQGQGTVLATVVLPNAFGHNSRLHPYPYDPATAQYLLTAAAYPAARPLVVMHNQDTSIFADCIALHLTKLGLQVRVEAVADLRPRETGPDAPWDIFLGSWGNSTLDPAGILVPKFTSQGRGNFSGFHSAELDQLILRAGATIDDSLRAEYYHQIQTVLFNQAPMIFGYAPHEQYGVAGRVHNFNPSSTGMLDLHDVFVVNGD